MGSPCALNLNLGEGANSGNAQGRAVRVLILDKGNHIQYLISRTLQSAQLKKSRVSHQLLELLLRVVSLNWSVLFVDY